MRLPPIPATGHWPPATNLLLCPFGSSPPMMPTAPEAAASSSKNKLSSLRPTRTRHARPRPHGRDLHDHLHGPHHHRVGHAPHPQGIRLLPHHRRLDSHQLPLGLHAFPNPRRLVRRQNRPAPRARTSSSPGGAYSPPSPPWPGTPHRWSRSASSSASAKPGAFPIATRSLSRWMLPAERGFAQGITHAGSRLGAAVTPPLVVWMILRYGWRMPFLDFRRARPGLVRGLVLLLSRFARAASRRQCGRARVDPFRHRRSAPANRRSRSLAAHPFQPHRVATSADVFLLPIRAGRLSGLVPHLFKYSSRIQPQADGLLRQPALAGRHAAAILRAAGFPIVCCASPATSHARAASLASPASSSRPFGILPADAHSRSQALRRFQLPRLWRTGVDRRRFLGHPARHRGRFRRAALPPS